jgi:lysophospholipase L1-like esterase
MLHPTLSGFVSLGFLTAALCCALGSAGAVRADEATVRPPEKGERIVFLGDSITEAGNQPGGYVSLVRDELASRFPALGIEVIGAGISGNKVPDLEARLDRDVLARKPSTVVIYIGINDVWHSLQGGGTPKETFEKGLRSIVERIRASGARTILCTPTVIGERILGSNPLDAMLDTYSDITRKVAADMKTGLLDLRKACGQHLAAHHAATKGAFTDDKGVLTSDSVHLNAAGNRFLADRMLEALGARAPAADGKVLRHVVLIKFKDSSSAADIEKVVTAFAALPTKISEIKGFEWGTDVSPEGKAEGMTHCFLLTFATAADRDAYLPHPAHREFGALVVPHIDKVCVVDYWATTP